MNVRISGIHCTAHIMTQNFFKNCHSVLTNLDLLVEL
uniref:Uncharacterized protein n=1 Tax=Arundo donax TaxID=35708 RepID=A0A0A9Q4S3_ARUDO